MITEPGAETAPPAPVLERDDLTRPEVLALLREHLADMVATSPPGSVHALDLAGLRRPAVTFWTAWLEGALVGCCALQDLGEGHGEIKSMRTVASARGRGLGAVMLGHLLDQARRRGWQRLSLETGSQEAFAPARRLYARHGFAVVPPFGAYREDPSSVFMSRTI
jgi:putative acetyltransferase